MATTLAEGERCATFGPTRLCTPPLVCLDGDRSGEPRCGSFELAGPGERCELDLVYFLNPDPVCDPAYDLVCTPRGCEPEGPRTLGARCHPTREPCRVGLVCPASGPSAGVCQRPAPIGAACTIGDQCESGACIEARCVACGG
ncbi:hypothetical protein [Sandaracinus amylolyticus]|uniref:hypothetical protein n=1 Tax=Sandaracinus amylolyticus TaxID=927083 RepID=UPI001F2FD140|nr:hypothetical protein [Sandaracinus amylolyticus]UJR82276.1 Hypothetical protein I5071_43410 [Sandaracinus amylolyticus]